MAGVTLGKIKAKEVIFTSFAFLRSEAVSSFSR
jgi:hypothetical protein